MPPQITNPPTRTPLPSEIISGTKLTSLSLPPTSVYSYSTWVYPTESISTFPSGFTPSPIPTWVVVNPFNASSSSFSSFSSLFVTVTSINSSDPGYNNIGDSPFYHWHDTGFAGGKFSPTALSFIVISCAVAVFAIAGILFAVTRRVTLRKRERAWRDRDPDVMFVDGVFIRRGPSSGFGRNGELGNNSGRMPYAEVDVMANLGSGGAGSGFGGIPARSGGRGSGGTWSRGALGSLGGTFGVLGVAGSIRRHLGISVKKTTADLDEGYGGDDAQNPSSSPLSTLSSSRSRSESTTTTGSTSKGDAAANGNMPARPTVAAAPIMPTPHIFEDGYSYTGHFGQPQGRNLRPVGPLEEDFESGDRPDSLQQSLAKQKLGWISGGRMYESTYIAPSEERISTVSYQVW